MMTCSDAINVKLAEQTHKWCVEHCPPHHVVPTLSHGEDLEVCVVCGKQLCEEGHSDLMGAIEFETEGIEHDAIVMIDVELDGTEHYRAEDGNE